MNEHDEATTQVSYLTLLRLSLDVLNRRIRLWVTMALSFGLFAAALYRPSPLRILAASLFTLMVHLPMAFRKEN